MRLHPATLHYNRAIRNENHAVGATKKRIIYFSNGNHYKKGRMGLNDMSF